MITVPKTVSNVLLIANLGTFLNNIIFNNNRNSNNNCMYIFFSINESVCVECKDFAFMSHDEFSGKCIC